MLAHKGVSNDFYFCINMLLATFYSTAVIRL